MVKRCSVVILLLGILGSQLPEAETVRLRATARRASAPEVPDKQVMDELVQAADPNTVSRLIHQSWISWGKLVDDEKCNVQDWRNRNPDFRYLFWTDNAVEIFLRDYAPHEDQEMLSKMKIVERLDYFRYLVLQKMGGVYADLDVTLRAPVSKWPGINDGSAKLVAGVEVMLKPDLPPASIGFARQNQFQQWTLVSAPGHRVLNSVLGRIREKWAKGETSETLHYTGPGPWTDAVLEFTGDPGISYVEEDFDEVRRGDIMILPQVKFSNGGCCGPSGMKNDMEELVRHHWFQSWTNAPRGSHLRSGDDSDAVPYCQPTGMTLIQAAPVEPTPSNDELVNMIPSWAKAEADGGSSFLELGEQEEGIGSAAERLLDEALRKKLPLSREEIIARVAPSK